MRKTKAAYAPAGPTLPQTHSGGKKGKRLRESMPWLGMLIPAGLGGVLFKYLPS